MKSQGAKLSFSSVSVRGGRLRPFADLPFSRAAGRLNGPSGRKPPADKGNARKAKEQSSAFRVFLCVGDAPGLLPGGFPPGRREQEPGLFPVRENRSPAWAHARKESRACEEWRRKRQGARLARRSRACVRDVGKKKTGSANCPPQVCANCSAQPRRRKSSAKLCGKRLDNSDKLYYNK